MLGVHTRAAYLLPRAGPREGGAQGLPATVPSILEKNRALGLARGAVCRRRAGL